VNVDPNVDGPHRRVVGQHAVAVAEERPGAVVATVPDANMPKINVKVIVSDYLVAKVVSGRGRRCNES